MAVKIVTDSASDIPPEMAKELDVTVVPATIFFGDEAFKDGIDLTQEEFFRRLTTGAVHPKTSQPSVGDFLEAYTPLVGEGHDIVSVHVSGKLSGTINSARNASQELPDARIETVDSGLASMGTTLAVKVAAEGARRGLPADQVAKAAARAAARIEFYVVFETLEYLQKGGRIGKAQALVGSLLSLKPILKLEDGEIRPHEKVRTRAKAVRRLIEIAESNGPYRTIALVHKTTPEEAQLFTERLAPLSRAPVITGEIGPAVGAHSGPGAIGVALLK